MRALRFFLPLVLFMVHCQRCRETPVSPSPLPSPPEKTDPAEKTVDITPTRDDTWVAQGDFPLLDGNLVSGGGQVSPISAGERVLITLHLGGLQQGVDLVASFEVAGREGVFLTDVEQALDGNQIRGTTGILQAVLQTGSFWPSGSYTLKVGLKAESRQGEMFIPFSMVNEVETETLPRIRVPFRLRAGRPFSVWASASREHHPDAKMQLQPGDKDPVEVSFPETDPAGVHDAVVLELTAPQEPGRLALFSSGSFTGRGNFRYGESLEVLPDEPGLYGLRFVAWDGVPRMRWKRRQEGMLLIEDPAWLAEDPGTLDIAILGPEDEVLYVRRMDLPPRPEGPVSLPFSIPEFSPAGRLRFRLRWTSQGRSEQIEHSLVVVGETIPRGPRFAIADLEIGTHPALVSRTRSVMPSGRTWHFSLVATGYHSGMQTQQVGDKQVPVPVLGISCSAQLAVSADKVVLDNPELVRLNHPLLYIAPRQRISASWQVPALPAGKHILRVECDDAHSRGSAQIQRMVTIR